MKERQTALNTVIDDKRATFTLKDTQDYLAIGSKIFKIGVSRRSGGDIVSQSSTMMLVS